MGKWYKLASITTTGSAGSATGSATNYGKDVDSGAPIPSGFVMAYYVDFTTMPPTTDVTISRVLPNGATAAMLTLTDKNTDGYYPVKEASYSTAGIVSTTDLIYPYTANGQFAVSVAQGDAVANGVVVWVAIES